MWRIVLLFLPIFLMGSSPASDDVPVYQIQGSEEPEQQDSEADSDEDVPTYRIEGDEPARLETDAEAGADADDDDDQDTVTTPETRPDFALGFVEWEFVPVIEVTDVEGAVTNVDAHRTLSDDQQAISDCFEPTSYPGDGTVIVDVHLSYNGIPVAVNGTTDGVVRPNQARCVLQRAWRYEFPRMADDADEDSRVQYRVSFASQRLGAPDREADQPQLLMERLTTSEEDLRSVIARDLFRNLGTVERCAALTVDQLPNELVTAEVKMNWRQMSERYSASRVDITVTNQTSSERPSDPVLSCYKRTLSNWELVVENGEELPEELDTTFFITVRPGQPGQM